MKTVLKNQETNERAQEGFAYEFVNNDVLNLGFNARRMLKHLPPKIRNADVSDLWEAMDSRPAFGKFEVRYSGQLWF
eukprot:COSAG01_NODE_40114_length_467_cov_2.046196_1_plen_77_part_00